MPTVADYDPEDGPCVGLCAGCPPGCFLVGPDEPCTAETRSWDHFTPEQVDSYWIRCTLAGPHDEHEDEHTGLTWHAEAAP